MIPGMLNLLNALELLCQHRVSEILFSARPFGDGQGNTFWG